MSQEQPAPPQDVVTIAGTNEIIGLASVAPTQPEPATTASQAATEPSPGDQLRDAAGAILAALQAKAEEPVFQSVMVITDDAFDIPVTLNMPGRFPSVHLRFRPITLRMWRKHRMENQKIVGDDPKNPDMVQMAKDRHREEFVCSRITEWDLKGPDGAVLPMTMDTLDNLWPDGYAEAILRVIQYGALEEVSVGSKVPTGEEALKN